MVDQPRVCIQCGRIACLGTGQARSRKSEPLPFPPEVVKRAEPPFPGVQRVREELRKLLPGPQPGDCEAGYIVGFSRGLARRDAELQSDQALVRATTLLRDAVSERVPLEKQAAAVIAGLLGKENG